MKKTALWFLTILVGLTPFYGMADSADLPREKKVLFICTGNFYRSRFAEAVFNYYSQNSGNPWRAFSRGIDLTVLTLAQKQAQVSDVVTKELERLGVPRSFIADRPVQLTQRDLEQSDYIVALSRQEHQSALEQRYPSQKNRIHYWEIGDSKTLDPAEAVIVITQNVKALLNDLGK